MGLNAIDGMLAREHDQASPLGAVLNELGDVVSDAALYLPFALINPFSPLLVICCVLLMAFGELASVAMTAQGIERRNDGPMGKSDRAVLFGLLGAGMGTTMLLGHPIPYDICWIMPALAVLLLITMANRIRRGLPMIDAQPEGGLK
ncbi:MAG: hypothetical protein Alpg2KO_16090 [Alphaproteobacteria bacterium]